MSDPFFSSEEDQEVILLLTSCPGSALLPSLTGVRVLGADAAWAEGRPQGAAVGGAAGAPAAGHRDGREVGQAASGVECLVTEADGVLVEG